MTLAHVCCFVMPGKSIRRGMYMVPAASRCKRKFRVGEAIHISGLYRVFHSVDGVSHEATLLRGEVFPPCTQCDDNVDFELLKELSEIDDSDYDFRIRLFQIPHPLAAAEADRKTA